MTTKPRAFLEVATLIDDCAPLSSSPRPTAGDATATDVSCALAQVSGFAGEGSIDIERPKFIDSATIQERLGDESGLVERLSADPRDPIAGAQLEALYQSRGDYEGLVTVLIERAEQADSDEERIDALLRAAHLYRTELSDLDSARLVVITALGVSASDDRIHEELDAVVCASGEFSAARAAYADAALQLGKDDPMAAGELWLRVASLHIMEHSGAAAVAATLARIQALSTERAAPVLAVCERMADDLLVLDALEALYRRIGDNRGVSRVLSLSIERATDMQDRARRHHDIATVAIDSGDDAGVEWHLSEALRLAPQRAQTRAVLSDLYRRRGEMRRAAAVLEDARHIVNNPVDRANMACQAAHIYADELGERTRAADLYAIALRSDPDRAEAAAPLAERYWRRGCYAELEPLIEVLVRRASDIGNKADIAELSYRAGKTAAELGKYPRALQHLELSLSCTPDRLDALRSYAEVLAAVDRPDDAFRSLARVLDIEKKRGTSDDALAGIRIELAELADKAGHTGRAIEMYRVALQHCPAHERALRGVCDLLRKRNDIPACAELLATAQHHAEGPARVRILAELAGLYARSLGDAKLAIDLYREALSLAPDDHEVLTGLAEIYTAAECWREAVDVLTTLAQLQSEAFRRGRYFQIAAQVAKNRLRDDETATLYAQALECFFENGQPEADARPICMRAFSDLESLLRDRGAHKALERAYRTMIKRMPPDASELPDLWARLGALYREELDQPQAAIESYEVAAALDDDRITRHRVLIDLYEGFAEDKLDKLIERRQRLLRAEPTVAEHYRALAKLHHKAGRLDHAYLAFRSLRSLGGATDREREALTRLECSRTSWPRSTCSPELLERLRHPGEDTRITGILAVVSEALGRHIARSPRKLRLRDDSSPAFTPLRNLYRSCAQLVGVAEPPLYITPEIDAELMVANVIIAGRPTVAVIAGRRLLSLPMQPAMYALCRLLSQLRPAYVQRLLHARPGELDTVFDAALMVGGYQGALPCNPGAVELASAIHRHLAPTMRGHLAAMVQSLGSRDSLSLAAWSDAVAATGRRIALLFTGDLQLATADLARELTHTSATPHKDRVADLLVHGCSDAHASARAAIGTAMG